MRLGFTNYREQFNAIDHAYRCILTLYPRQQGLKPFDLIVYGRTASDLYTVPNEVIQTLAARYPDYTSSMFDVYNLGDNK